MQRLQGTKRSLDEMGRQLQPRINEVLGRSLHIREVEAGSCNGCEVEIDGLNSPIPPFSFWISRAASAKSPAC